MRTRTDGSVARRAARRSLDACGQAVNALSVPTRLLTASAIAYAASFVLLLRFWHPGRGIGSTLYLPIVLAAIATGPLLGAAAGAFASALYWTSLILGFDKPLGIVVSSAGAIHLLNFVLVGVVVGYFARRTRHLLRDSLHVLDDLLELARRDLITCTGSAVGFEAAATARLRERLPFVLLLASPPEQPGRRHQPDEDKLRVIAAALSHELAPHDELARVGRAEFAMLVSCPQTRSAGALAPHFEQALEAAGVRLSFGWAASPQDGSSVLELYAAATARLYARRSVRNEWNPSAASASLVADLESHRRAASG